MDTLYVEFSRIFFVIYHLITKHYKYVGIFYWFGKNSSIYLSEGLIALK